MVSLPFQSIIVDLDRTLLRTDKSVSAYTREVLAGCRQAGAYLYAATARPERAIEEYRRMIDFRSVTTLNGARTITPAGVSENPIGFRCAALILEQLCRIDGTVISAETDKGIFANREIPLWQPAVTDNIRKLAEDRTIYKILASHPCLEADRIRIIPPEGTYCTVADGTLLQFMSCSATKWNGIRGMLDHDHIDAEKAICFGDDNDDLEPIRKCGRGVAVSNALECVKEAADAVTLSNDEDGVAKYLERYLLPDGTGCRLNTR